MSSGGQPVDPADHLGLVYAQYAQHASTLPARWREEMLGAGFEALVRAARTWNPGRAPWSAYANNAIRHAMRDERRRFVGRTGRSLRRAGFYASSLDFMNVSDDGDDVGRGFQMPAGDILAHPAFRVDHGTDPADEVVAILTVSAAFERLTPILRAVAAALFSGRRPTDIAADLGVTQGRISQHKQALRRHLHVALVEAAAA